MELSMNAHRFAQKPLPQPTYLFSEVSSRPPRDLQGYTLQHVTDRSHLHECIAEMLLLCKEAVRRRNNVPKSTGSKPLSLDYMVDRVDVDDPLWGYMLRNPQGMLQGFVTVTTFTNYQKTFRWDSMHEAAFDDHEELKEQMEKGTRKYDQDGQLARELQSTVRFGSIWNEGVVWPRIAEISLLGGLGCGKTLMSLVIEKLERMKASNAINYDYVVLHATENSISFYESLGFIRVGAITQDEKRVMKGRMSGNDPEAEEESGSDEKSDGTPIDYVARAADITSSPCFEYTTLKRGESLSDIAKKFKVDTWDVAFLNQDICKTLAPSSKFMNGTRLRIPDKDAIAQNCESIQKGKIEWYIAKENETPRSIAKKLKLNCLELVEANKARMPDIISNSRLRNKTRVQVSHFSLAHETYIPYDHWSFPDDQFDEGEAAYMMVRKLEKCKGVAQKESPILDSLAVHVSEYKRTPLVVDASELANGIIAPSSDNTQHHDTADTKDEEAAIVEMPIPPKRPMNPFFLFCHQQRPILKLYHQGLTGPEMQDKLKDEWNKLPITKKSRYEMASSELKTLYMKEKDEYQRKLALYEQAQGPTTADGGSYYLYNQVVRLKPGALTEGVKYTYWYVITYVPDLMWCHLGPLIPSGRFGSEKPNSEGRTRYKLAKEDLKVEVDLSSMFCVPIKARVMRKVADADKEEWDITDDGKPPLGIRKRKVKTNISRDGPVPLCVGGTVITHSTTKSDARRVSKCSKNRTRDYANGNALFATMPGTRKEVFIRIHVSEEVSCAKPRLVAKMPSSGEIVQVSLCLADDAVDIDLSTPGKRSRKRPQRFDGIDDDDSKVAGNKNVRSSSKRQLYIDDNHAVSASPIKDVKRRRINKEPKISRVLDIPNASIDKQESKSSFFEVMNDGASFSDVTHDSAVFHKPASKYQSLAATTSAPLSVIPNTAVVSEKDSNTSSAVNMSSPGSTRPMLHRHFEDVPNSTNSEETLKRLILSSNKSKFGDNKFFRHVSVASAVHSFEIDDGYLVKYI